MQTFRRMICTALISMLSLGCASASKAGQPDARIDLLLQQGTYHAQLLSHSSTDSKDRSEEKCGDADVDWSGAGKDTVLSIGANDIFGDINNGIQTDPATPPDICRHEVETRTQTDLLVQAQREFCPWGKVVTTIEIHTKGQSFHYKITRTSSDTTKRSSFHTECMFKLVQ